MAVGVLQRDGPEQMQKATLAAEWALCSLIFVS